MPVPANGSGTGGGTGTGGGWSNLTATLTTAPTGRTQPMIAYDPSLQKVVLFGGYDVSVNADGDTWEFANNSWTDLTSSLATAPPARWGGTMVWDPVVQALVLFGGRNVTSYLNDTWSFNGTAWTQIGTTSAPSPRAQFQMAYDTADSAVLLQGGDWRNLASSVVTWHFLDDVWSFQRGTWTNLTSNFTSAPGVRGLGQSAYDPWNRSVVEVGGLTNGVNTGCTPAAPVATLVMNQTYAYPSSVGPGALAQEMMTYVPDGPYLFLFGGYAQTSAGCAQANFTWVRVEGHWVNITAASPSAPSIRYLGGIAYDAAEDEVLLFGGNSAGSYLGDTWTFTIPAVTPTIASSRSGGTGPLNISFNASVTGGSEYGFTYNWSFGDGSVANGSSSVTHQFVSLGTYTVRLNVSDLLNRTGSTSTTIVVVSPLVAAPTASDLVGSVPLTESFRANPSGGEHPYTGLWTFGDGTSATGLNTTHTYTVAGSYEVNLSLSDTFGDRAAGNLTIGLAPTLAVVIPGGHRVGVVPFPVNFTANASGGNPPLTYAWSFGDGGTSAQPDPSHIYTVAGAYNATLVVQDSLGRTVTATTTVTAVSPLSAALYATTTEGIAPLSIDFTVAPAGGLAPYSATWSFGDGASGVGLKITHSFTTVGNHTVVANVTDALGERTTELIAVSVVLPLAGTVTANTTTTEEPDGVTFEALTSGGIAPFNWTWSFGDGTSAWSAGPIVHHFPTPSAYDVTLTVSDGLGEVSHASLGVTVRPMLSATLSASESRPWTGNLTNFTVTVTGGEGPFDFSWSGLPTGCSASDAPAISCRPSTAGPTTVTVTVRDTLNRSVVRTLSVDVVPAPPPASVGGGSGVDLWLVGGLLTVIAVGATIGIWGLRRRRGPPTSEAGFDEGPYDPAAVEAPGEPTEAEYPGGG